MSTRDFDCVEMKHGIQRSLRKRRAGLGWHERNRLVRDAISKDPHLRRLLDASVTEFVDQDTQAAAAATTRRKSGRSVALRKR